MYLNYLKFYNYCLKDIEPLTFAALMGTVVQTRKLEKKSIPLLKKDARTLGLIIEKFIKREISFSDRKKFLSDLSEALKNRHSMKIFLTVPNYL